MLIWYRTELIDSIKSIKIGKSYIWLKIQKDIVSTDRHIFLCATYLPPAESPYYNEETFSILQDEICHFQTKGNVLICGELNARTGNEPDCHKSVPWTSVHSPPEVTHSPHGLLHYTAYPIIHCTDDTHTADYTNHAHTWELSHNHYHPITHSL